MEPSQEERIKNADIPSGHSNGFLGSLFQTKKTLPPTYMVERLAMRIVLIYVISAALWIAVTDPLLAALITDSKLLVKLEVMKGWAYVVVTALLLFFLLRRETRHWTGERVAREEAEAAAQLQGERQRLLLEVSRLAWEAGDSERELSSRLMAQIGPHIRADLCLHYRLEESTGRLLLISGIGVPPEQADRFKQLNPGQSFCGLVAATGKALTVDSQQVAEHAHGELARLLGMHAYTAHPLLARDGRVLGTLSFASTTRKSFTREEDALIQIVCRFASLATERMRAMAALRDGEVRFRQLFDLAPLPISASGPDGVLVDFNRRFEQVIGYTPEEIPTLREWWLLAFPEETYRRQATASWEAAVKRAERNNTNIEPEEYRIVCRNGEKRVFLISGTRLRDGVLAAFVDITERKRTETALRESEARYRLLAEHTADVIWVYDVSLNRFVFVSPSVERMRGFTPEEAQEQTMEQSVTPASYARVQKNFPERLESFHEGEAGAVIQVHEVEQPCKDGSTVWTEVSTTLIKTPSGSVQVLGVSRDITARRKMESEFHRQEILLRETTALAHIGGWEFDPVTLEGTWTEETARIHDLDPNEKTNVAKGVSFYTGSSRTKIEAAVKQAIEQGTPYDLELEISTAAGRKKWVRAIAHAMVENGKVMRIRGTFQDISVRKRAEAFAEGQKQILEMIANGDPLRAILVALLRVAEAQCEGMLCSISLLDPDGLHLRDAASPSLPASYTNTLDGARIGPAAGSCGTAVFRKEPVYVEDIGTDPLWQDYKEVALAHGLKACWSNPIFGDGHEVWGSFAAYFRHPCKPEAEHLRLIDLTTHTAAIAINRHRVESALQASEEQSRAVVESAPDAIFIQTHGRFAYLNPMAVQLFGAENEQQMIGRSVLDQFHPDCRQKVLERIRQLNEERRPVPVLAEKILRCDGTSLEVEVSAVPFVFGSDKGALVFARDNSERKKAELVLRESAQRLQSVIENLSEGLIIARLDGQIIHWNRAALRMYGFNTEGDLIHDLPSFFSTFALTTIEGEPVPFKQLPLARIFRGEQLHDVQLRIRRISGGWDRIFSYDGAIAPDIVGTPVAFLMVTDITSRFQAEEALRESEERFRQVVENMDEVFWMTEPSRNRMLYVSPAYKKIWGRECESLYASPENWAAAIHPDDRQRVVEAAVNKQALGTYAESFRILRPNGDMRWIHDRAFPVRDHDGRVYRVVGTATDITEHRKLEEQFRQAQKMEAIGTLAGGIAHDFNNILGAIIGYTELAGMDAKTPAVRSSLDEILRACKRAGDLVRQILTFSRQQEQKRLPMQLWRVIEEATRLLRAALPSTIQFEIELAKNAPTVLADPTQIHQVVMNLCTNAAHAMAGRPGRLGIKLDRFEADEEFAKLHPGCRPGGYARLTVSDTGHGMEKSVLGRIFEPFFTTKAPGEGTGLGLSVVHGIVQSHEGFITVYSRPGEGTTFHLYFPAHESNEVEAAVASGVIPRGKGERILIVDDELPLAQMAGKVLEKLGYQVEVTAEPVKALATIRSAPKHFDLLITDMTMPDLTGMELADGVHQEYPGIPIILMTGFFTKQGQEQVQSAGIREVLLKPITMRNLGEAVHRLLNP